MGPLPLDLERLQEHLGELLAALLLGAQMTPAQENPAPLLSAFGRVFQDMARLDADALRQPSESSPDIAHAASALGESAHWLLKLAADCLDWNEPARSDQSALLHVGFAYWVARHGGTAQDLPALVDCLTRLDGGSTDAHIDPVDLTTVLLALIDSNAKHQRAQMPAPNDPRDPWRLLHLHACTTAQRTQRADLIQKAYSRLLRHLPADVTRCGHTATDLPWTETAASLKTSTGTRPGDHRHESHKPTLH